MRRIEPAGLSGNDLLAYYRTALSTKAKMNQAAKNGQAIELDLRAAEWFSPAFLAPICVCHNQLVADGVEIDVRWPSDRRIQRYLRQIRFPEGTATPTREYDNNLPLCSMNTDRDADVVELVGSKIRELIKDQFPELADDGGIMWINYPIIEVIDNVDYHSDCEFGALLVQNYPRKPFLDLCIADNGVSIPGNFERYGIDFKSDEAAVRRAMEEGLSTRTDTGHKRGFGLRTTVEMVCDGLNGELFLSSRQATLGRGRSGGPTRYELEHEWNGTVFIARLNQPDGEFNYLDYIYPE